MNINVRPVYNPRVIINYLDVCRLIRHHFDLEVHETTVPIVLSFILDFSWPILGNGDGPNILLVLHDILLAE